MEDGGQSSLPTKQDEEFRPFIRRLPEFKFWHAATRAIVIGFLCSWFQVFNVPVFWPVLVVYWMILFALTSEWIPVLLQRWCWSESYCGTARHSESRTDQVKKWDSGLGVSHNLLKLHTNM